MQLQPTRCKECGRIYHFYGKHSGYCNRECRIKRLTVKQKQRLAHEEKLLYLNRRVNLSKIMHDVDWKIKQYSEICGIYESPSIIYQ